MIHFIQPLSRVIIISLLIILITFLSSTQSLEKKKDDSYNFNLQQPIMELSLSDSPLVLEGALASIPLNQPESVLFEPPILLKYQGKKLSPQSLKYNFKNKSIYMKKLSFNEETKIYINEIEIPQFQNYSIFKNTVISGPLPFHTDKKLKSISIEHYKGGLDTLQNMASWSRFSPRHERSEGVEKKDMQKTQHQFTLKSDLIQMRGSQYKLRLKLEGFSLENHLYIITSPTGRFRSSSPILFFNEDVLVLNKTTNKEDYYEYAELNFKNSILLCSDGTTISLNNEN